MSESELKWLALQAELHRSIVEVGCYLGRSTRALGDNCSGFVYAVDNWDGPNDIAITHPRSELYGMFCANLGDLLASYRVIPIRKNSLDAAAGWDAMPPDMVFIDGSHDEKNCSDDIIAWSKVLKPGGLLCGHDANWEGVSKALANVLPGNHLVGIGSLWATYKGLC